MPINHERNRRPFQPKPDAEEIIRSATEAIRGIIDLPNVSTAHKQKMITLMLWMITEAHGKYTTRFRSASVMAGEVTKIQHDHVHTRKSVRDAIMANPLALEEIIKMQAIACVVTEQEHRALATLGRGYKGWERYEAAGITVIDTSVEGMSVYDYT